MKRILLGLTGGIGVGKTTAAGLIDFQYPHGTVQRLAFADPVKRITKMAFMLDDRWLTDEAKNTIHPMWGITPRDMFRKVGTDLFVDTFGTDFWIKHMKVALDKAWKSMEDKAPVHEESFGIVVITDVRNITGDNAEANWVRSLGGRVVHIKGPNRRDPGALHKSDQAVNFVAGEDEIWDNSESEGGNFPVLASQIRETVERLQAAASGPQRSVAERISPHVIKPNFPQVPKSVGQRFLEAFEEEGGLGVRSPSLSFPSATVTLPSLGTGSAAGEATISVEAKIDGVSYQGTATLRGKTSTPHTSKIVLHLEVDPSVKHTEE